jgi:hypothetical protein
MPLSVVATALRDGRPGQHDRVWVCVNPARALLFDRETGTRRHRVRAAG